MNGRTFSNLQTISEQPRHSSSVEAVSMQHTASVNRSQAGQLSMVTTESYGAGMLLPQEDFHMPDQGYW
jgi:hypothetical protein